MLSHHQSSFILATALMLLLFSGCTIPSIPVNKAEVEKKEEEKFYDDVKVSMRLLKTVLHEGDTLRAEITVEALRDVEDVTLNIVNDCGLSFDSKKEELGDIKKGSVRTITLEGRLEKGVDLTRECELKFRISYKSTSKITTDVIVLSEREYERMLVKGKSYVPSSSQDVGAVGISYSLSPAQPYKDGDTVFFSFHLYNRGSGTYKITDISFSAPSNLVEEGSKCGGLKSSSIELMGGESEKVVCKFQAHASEDVSIDSLSLSVEYLYKIDVKERIILERR